jgi:hypothetical protein
LPKYFAGFRTMGSGVRVSFSVLETLDRQTEAIGMYQKCGYTVIDNYEPYLGLKNSICMRKQI